jgi:hypothetical protein
MALGRGNTDIAIKLIKVKGVNVSNARDVSVGVKRSNDNRLAS